MNKRAFDIIKLVFFLGLGVFLVWYSIHQIPNDQFEQFKKSLKTAKYWLIVPVFLILSSSHIIRALRWKLLMEPLGYKPKLANTFLAVMIGYLANFAFPRLGEVLKCTILAKYENVPADKNVGTIVAERAFDVVCLLIVFLLALIFEYNAVIEAYHKLQSLTQPKVQEQNILWNYIKIGILVVFLVLIIWSIITKKILNFINKLKQVAKGIFEGVASAWRLKQKGMFLIYSLVIWILYITGTWIGLYATEGSEVGFSVALACLAFSSIGMIITPGGIGSYAILTALVLELYKVPYSIGLANGTLQWFAQFIIVLIVGFVCLILLPIYNKTQKV